jgi:hypothetical protein
MFVIEPNNEFERAVNAAFMSNLKSGEGELTFESGKIELILHDGSSEEKIEFRTGTKIHFFHDRPLTKTHGRVINPGDRLRNHYVITFGNHGSLSVDARDARNKHVTLKRENDHVAASKALQYVSEIN